MSVVRGTAAFKEELVAFQGCLCWQVEKQVRRQGLRHQMDVLVGSLSVVLWFGALGHRLVFACLGFQIAFAMTHV